MTKHKMRVEVDFDVDESDIISYASELLADRVEKNAWYHKIREGVDAMVLDEVKAKVHERVALALDRGVTIDDGSYYKTQTPGLQSAMTGAGGDWYETESIDAYIGRVVAQQVRNQVSDVVHRVEARLRHKIDTLGAAE